MVEAGIDGDSYKFGNGQKTDGESESISRLSLAHFLALDEVINEMPRLAEKRDFVQSRRKRSDTAIFSLFKEPFRHNIFDDAYTKAQEELKDVFKIEELYGKRNHVLIISTDAVGKRMAGPAIRCWEFANVLSKEHEVVLAIPNQTDLDSTDFQIDSYQGEQGSAILNHWVTWCDVLICQGFVLNDYPFLQKAGKPIVVDIYDTLSLEILELFKYKGVEERVDVHQARLSMLNEQLKIGDFFICSSEKQRDFWIGAMSSLNRVNPRVYDSDKTLRAFIDVIPFGIPAVAPRHSKRVLKGVHENIKEDDKLILWAGGIYNWFDPLTLIRALGLIAKERKDVKLFFMGLKHPNPDVSEMEIVRDAINLSKDLGLYEKQIFFNFGWVPYEERQNYLLEANIGVTTHPQHLETEYSFRTRIMDYIWANLPIVFTKGGPISEMIERYELGKTVEAENPDELAAALLELLDNPKLYESFRENMKNLASRFIWEDIAEPLRIFCSDPRFAPDKFRKERISVPLECDEVENNGEKLDSLDNDVDVDRNFGYYLGKLTLHYRNGGFHGLIHHGRDLLSRLIKP